MKKRFVLSALILGGLVGVLSIGGQSVSAASNMNDPVQSNSKEAIVNRVEERFSRYKDTDRLLPVDGGYLEGAMTEKLVLNGKTIPGTEKRIDAKADTSKTKTVAEIKRLEISYAEKGVSSGVSKDKNQFLKFTNVPEKVYDLDPGEPYTSGGFNGGFLEFAGFFFQNKNGSFIQDWRVFGDSALIGDSTDAWTTYNTAGVTTLGYLLNPSSATTAINSTNGYPQLTFYSFHPAAGSGYQVFGR